ncbi:MAG: leucine-rich repeat domain-containing protein [Holosporales bacterium]|nr:leucine-rich repeat domain-containing protein [Holosporales bacterium]
MPVPVSARNIGQNAFSDCHSLVSVTFDPDSRLTTIGKESFSGSVVQGITLPAKVQNGIHPQSFSSDTVIAFQ